MRFSQLVFPFPNPPTYNQDRLVGELLYVPKDFSDCPEKYVEHTTSPSSNMNSAMKTIAANNKGRVLQDIGNNRAGPAADLDNISVQRPNSTSAKLVGG